MKKFMAFVLMSVVLLSLGGCGGKEKEFNAEGYVQAVLDAKFHGTYKEYAKVIGVSEKEAKEQMEGEFKECLKEHMTEFANLYGITDEEMEQYLQIESEARAKVQYKVKGAVKDEDGNYTVDVEITPYLVYDKLDSIFQGKWIVAAQNGATEDQCKSILLESFKECVENAEAAETVTFTFHVLGEEKENKIFYGIGEEEMLKLDLIATGQNVE